jgi:hypothetical protein
MSDLAQRWRAFIDGRMGPQGLPDVLKMPLVSDWDRLRQPGSASERQFGYALEIAFAYPDHPMIKQFLERALEIAERSLREKPELSEPRMRVERQAVIKCKNYCRAILYEEPLCFTELVQCGQDLLDQVRDSGEGWDAGDQCDHLKAVMLFLIAGELELASELLLIKRSFKWYLPWYKALQNLIIVAKVAADRNSTGTTAARDFEDFFDAVRDVQWPASLEKNSLTSRSIQRFEMSLIRYLYLSHAGEPVSWPKIFEQVSADSSRKAD